MSANDRLTRLDDTKGWIMDLPIEARDIISSKDSDNG